MSYIVLARKYRPQTFEEIVEQKHVTRTLANAVESNRVSHAILFSGPRGTGKTTVARILAKALNCEKGPSPVPCNRCRSCLEITAGNSLDVFEIDGASNNSVDQVRDLRETVKYSPAYSLYKIYIIDEVHMLSVSAFNALLKTLEEPPAHVIFLFATTEIRKIPVTILSRCQRHELRRVTTSSIYNHLAWICSREGVEHDKKSLWLLAQQADGSIRDALSLLDQIISFSDRNIRHEEVLEILGVTDFKSYHELTEAIITGDTGSAVMQLETLYGRGVDMRRFYAGLMKHVRHLIVAGKKLDLKRLLDLPEQELEMIRSQAQKVPETRFSQILEVLLKEESTIRFASQPKLAFEMILFKIMRTPPSLPIDTLIDRLDGLRTEILEGGAFQQEKTRYLQPVADGEPARHNAIKEEVSRGIDLEGVCEVLSKRHPGLAASMSDCRIEKTGEGYKLFVDGNGFTKKLILREKNIKAIKSALESITGSNLDLKIVQVESREEKAGGQTQGKRRLEKEVLNHPVIAKAVTLFEGRIVDIRPAGKPDGT